MSDVAATAPRERLLTEILGRSGLPNAPLAMPKQVLVVKDPAPTEIYTRLVRRT